MSSRGGRTDFPVATAVQPEVLKKLVSELGVSQDKSRSQMQLREMAERGELNSQLVRGRPPAGERWYVSCFQRALAIKGIASVYEGSNDFQIARN